MIFQDPHSALESPDDGPSKRGRAAHPSQRAAGRGAVAASGGAAGDRGTGAPVPLPLSARALGRAEAAGVHRPGDRARAGAAGAGRADLRPRRLGAGADPRVPEDASEGPGADLPVHLAQPRGGALPLRASRGDVPRAHRGGGRDRGRVRRAAPPVHRGVAERGTVAGVGAALGPQADRRGRAEPGGSAPGCSFHTRCEKRIAGVCDTLAPPEVATAPGHRTSCHLYGTAP